jgi:hypothetical protein
VAEDELVEDVKRAVGIAREAMEQDSAEARKRGWGVPAPDSASVGMLAAGILVANAIKREREEQEQQQEESASRVRRARAPRARTSRVA